MIELGAAANFFQMILQPKIINMTKMAIRPIFCPQTIQADSPLEITSENHPLKGKGMSSFDLVDYHLEILLAVAHASFAVLSPAKVHRIELFALNKSLLGGGFE